MIYYLDIVSGKLTSLLFNIYLLCFGFFKFLTAVYFQTFQEHVEKDLKPLITETNERLLFSLNQSRHQIAVQQELRALLEHEKVCIFI